MSRIGQAEKDLDYVRSALHRAEQQGSPASIYYLWAVLNLAGFTLIDLRPQDGWVFWAIAGPAGGVASFVLGWRWHRRLGQGSSRIALYHALHWGGMLGAVFLCIPIHMRGLLGHEGLPHVILLIVALGWYSAGVYLERPMMLLGIVLGLSNVALLFIEGFTWTIVGVLLALSLVASALLGGRRGRQEA